MNDDDLTKRVGKLEEDMGDLKSLIRGYWNGTERVPGVLDVLKTQQDQIGVVVQELKTRDTAHEKFMAMLWSLVKPTVIGIISIVVLQLIIMVARVGVIPH